MGGIAGLVSSGWLRARATRRALYLAAAAVWPVLYALLVPLPPILAATAIVFAVGWVAGAVAPIEATLVQERTPPQLLPRVVGIQTAVFRIAGPVAILATGVAIERLGLSTTLAVLTAGTVVFVVVAAVDGGVRRFDERPASVSAPGASDVTLAGVSDDPTAHLELLPEGTADHATLGTLPTATR